MTPFAPLIAVALAVSLASPAETPSALESQPEGWVDLLSKAGPSLKGWTRAPLKVGETLPESSQWSLDPATGVLLCKGNGGHEWLRWDQELGDFVYHVEWRFTPVEGKKGYNSGIYARNSADATVWHQAQTGGTPKGFMFGATQGEGKPRSFNLAKQVTDDRVKPPGEWNTYEVTCRGPVMSLWVNGAEVCALKDCGAKSGFVGLEAEGYRIEFRNVKVKTLGR